MTCIFCQISAGQIPAKKITETDHSMAFMDAAPLTAGHCLVIPKQHHARIQDMSRQDATDLFELTHALIARVDKITGATLMAVHNGKESGQEIPHVHVHLIPRSAKDLAGPVHSMFESAPKPTQEQTEQAYRVLSGM